MPPVCSWRTVTMVLPDHKVAITKQSKHCVKLIQKLLSRKGIRAPVRRFAFIEKHQAGVYLVTMHFSIVDAASIDATLNSYNFVSVNHYP